MRLLIIFILVFPNFLSAAIPGIEIKETLQAELRSTYLTELEKRFGNCGSNPESCLSQIDDYLVLNLPKKEMCFPYTMCGFYHCMEEKYQCEKVGVDYFTKLAYPTCSAYVKNISAELFSKKGVEWIYTVMVCLQKGLADECELKGNCPVGTNVVEQKKTCDHITDFTLAYHPGCYIKSGVGVCKLPLKDKQNIWKTVGPYLTAREKKEAYKVIFQCFIPPKSGISI
jgi:hypothetical protein